MQATKVRQQIESAVTLYQTTIAGTATVADLAQPTTLLFDTLTPLVFPGHYNDLVKHINPQDMEESKEQVSDQLIFMMMQRLSQAVKDKKSQNSQEIMNLKTALAEQQQFLKKYNQFGDKIDRSGQKMIEDL